MEQEVRELLEERVADRSSVLRQIAESWGRQSRRPRASEIDSWIAAEAESFLESSGEILAPAV